MTACFAGTPCRIAVTSLALFLITAPQAESGENSIPRTTSNTKAGSDQPARPSQEREQKPALAGERYAFLVGVQNYPKAELTTLKYPEADIDALADLLEKKLGYSRDNIVTLTQSRGGKDFRFTPTAENILKEFKLLIREPKTEDTILVAFAGHGVQFDRDTHSYYCPVDAKLTAPRKLVSFSEVIKLLDKSCSAGTKVLLVDACRNDPLANVRRGGIELKPAGLRRPQVIPGGIASIFSCEATETAFEHPELKHGVFFNYVLEGLNGSADLDRDQEVSLAELEHYTKKNVPNFVRSKLGQSQTPASQVNSRGQVVLARLSGRVAPAPSTKPGEVRTNGIGMKLVLVPAGEFMMGSPKEEVGRTDEELLHRVRISRSFEMGVYEVTVGQFRQFVAATNYRTTVEKNGKGGVGWTGVGKVPFDQRPHFNWSNWWPNQTDQHPVVCLSWHDAMAFCQWLSKHEGVTYSLPTEAQWEYACRAGTTTRFSTGNSDESARSVANVGDVALKQIVPESTELAVWNDGFALTSPIGRFRANAFGLYDMHGNAEEWCSDLYDDTYYARSPVDDPVGPSSGSLRILRGGNWNFSPNSCCSAARNGHDPECGDFGHGFRVVCER